MKHYSLIFLLILNFTAAFTANAVKKSPEEALKIAKFIANRTGPVLYYYLVKIGTEGWDTKKKLY